MAKKSKSILNPQQAEFLSHYTNPHSETFGNANQSALKAKYSKTYSENITDAMPEWLLENVGDMKLLNKAVKVLDETLDMDDTFETDKGTRRDSSLTRIKQDSAKFVAERIGKKRFSLKSNLLDDDGKPIPIPIYGGISIKSFEVPRHDGDQEALPTSEEN